MDFEFFRSSLFILHVVSAMFAIQVFLSEEFRLYDQEIYSVLKRKPPPLTAPLQKVVSTKEIRKIDTCLVSLSSSQLSGNSNSQKGDQTQCAVHFYI